MLSMLAAIVCCNATVLGLHGGDHFGVCRSCRITPARHARYVLPIILTFNTQMVMWIVVEGLQIAGRTRPVPERFTLLERQRAGD